MATQEDIIIGTDNEQKLGKTYTTSISSNLTTSVISVVVAFILRMGKFYQYLRSGCTSNWRFTEKKFSSKEKDIVLAKAMLGREQGNKPAQQPFFETVYVTFLFKFGLFWQYL